MAESWEEKYPELKPVTEKTAANFKAFRKDFSKEKLAVLLKVSPRTITRIEAGDLVPSLLFYIHAARVFHVRPEAFWGDDVPDDMADLELEFARHRNRMDKTLAERGPLVLDQLAKRRKK